MAGYEELVDSRKPVLRYVIGAGLLILLGVLIWVAVAAVRGDSKPAAQRSGAGSSSQSGTSQASGAYSAPSPTSSGATPSPGSTPSASTTSNQPAAGSAASTPPSGSGSPQNLANTGPGDVIILFLGVTFLGWLVHYRYTKHSVST